MPKNNNPQSSTALRLLGARTTPDDLTSVVPENLPDYALCWVESLGRLFTFVRRPISVSDPLIPGEIPAGNSAGTFGRWLPLAGGGTLSTVSAQFFTDALTIVTAPNSSPGLTLPSTQVAALTSDWSVPVAGFLGFAYSGPPRLVRAHAGMTVRAESAPGNVAVVISHNAFVQGAMASHAGAELAAVSVETVFTVVPGSIVAAKVSSLTGAPLDAVLRSAYLTITPV